MLRAVLFYAQPLKNRMCTASEYFFKLLLSVTPIRFIPVIERLRNLGRIQLIAKSSSLYTNLFAPQAQDLLEKLSGKSPLQLSSRTHFAKIEDKKVIAKN